ncbi:MAG: phosphate transport regulator, partial [Sulfolobales archaeon]
SVNPRKVGEIYSNIVKLEDSVDDFYRHALVDVVKSKEFDAGDLVLMKELIDKLEDAADHLKDVGTNLRYISLHRI